MPVSSYVYILALKLWIRVLHLEYPQKLEMGLMYFCCLTKSMPTLFHCQQARPYPGVSVGGTPLALPNSPLPPSENALPFLVASPPSLVQAPGSYHCLWICSFLYWLSSGQQQDATSSGTLPAVVPKTCHLAALSFPD